MVPGDGQSTMNGYTTISVYFGKKSSLYQSWNNSCYVTITMVQSWNNSWCVTLTMDLSVAKYHHCSSIFRHNQIWKSTNIRMLLHRMEHVFEWCCTVFLMLWIFKMGCVNKYTDNRSIIRVWYRMLRCRCHIAKLIGIHVYLLQNDFNGLVKMNLHDALLLNRIEKPTCARDFLVIINCNKLFILTDIYLRLCSFYVLVKVKRV